MRPSSTPASPFYKREAKNRFQKEEFGHAFYAAEPVFVNVLKEPMDRFPAWQAGLTTLFEVPARQAT
jgi:hypothetical protein